MTELTRILIVDDHSLLAEGIALGLRRAGLEVEIARSLGEADVKRVVLEFRPDVVLLDLMLGEGVGTGDRLLHPLRDVSDARILMLTGVTDPVALAACIEAGADGVVSKAEAFDTTLEAILRAANGEPVLGSHEREEMLGASRRERDERRRRLRPFEALTPREEEVLAGLVDGMSPREIAEASFVGLATVRTQINAVHRKLGVNSQLAAVALAHRSGWSPAVAYQQR